MAKKEIQKRKRVEEEEQVSEDDSMESDGFDASDIELEDDDSDTSSIHSNATASTNSSNQDEDDDDFSDLKKNKDRAKSKKKNPEAFSEAMSKILASSLKGADKDQPILARSKGTERKIEDEKLEHRARKKLTAERKALKEKGRVIPDYTNFDYEKGLRKVATRGVVKLFNAVRTQQKATEVAVTGETKQSLAAKEKAQRLSTMSKANFLDLLKSGDKA